MLPNARRRQPRRTRTQPDELHYVRVVKISQETRVGYTLVTSKFNDAVCKQGGEGRHFVKASLEP